MKGYKQEEYFSWERLFYTNILNCFTGFMDNKIVHSVRNIKTIYRFSVFCQFLVHEHLRSLKQDVVYVSNFYKELLLY